MKKILVPFLILLSYGCFRINRVPDETKIPINENSLIVQTCLDSLIKEISFKSLTIRINEVILERTKYLVGKPVLWWGYSPLKYKAVPDSLKISIGKMDISRAHPYILKIDSVSSGGSKAFVRILCVTQRSQTEYQLSKLKSKWVIREASGMDYEENSGPTIIK